MGKTIKDIAREAGVSVSTVSNIINNKEKNYNSETKEKVLEVIDKHNYVPSQMARSLTMKQSKNVACITFDLVNSYSIEILRGVEEACWQHEYNLHLYNIGRDYDKLRACLEMLKSKDIVGVVVVCSMEEVKEELKSVVNQGIHVVCVVETDAVEGIHMVGVNSFIAGLKGTRYLLERGHTNIAYISRKDNYLQNLVYKGFKQAYIEKGMVHNEKIVFETEYDVEAGYEALKQLKSDEYTAVFATHEKFLVGVYRYCKDHDRAPGKDIEILAYGEVSRIQDLICNCPKVSMQGYEVGKRAIKIIMKLIEGKEKVSQINSMIPRLVEPVVDRIGFMEQEN